MASAEVRLLGKMAILDRSGRAVEVSQRKAQALLAFLVLNPDQRHSRQRLAGLLWGDRGEVQARHSLSKSLSALRRSLGGDAADVIGADPNDIWLQSDAIRIDIEALRNLVTQEEDSAVEAALALCRGELLEDFVLRESAFNEWLAAERTVVRRLQAETLVQLGEASLGRGDVGSATTLAERLVSLDPLDEAAHRLLMRAHAQAGRRTAALTQYQACKDLLQRELGVAPEAATCALFEELKASEEVDQGSLDGAADEVIGKAGPVETPSVAVLAFTNLSGDPEQEYFSDGITEDIVTELSRFRSLSVMARHSSFAFKGKPVTARQVGEELGVQYVLEGRIQKEDGRVRATAQLVDAATGGHIWAEHYDRELEDIFQVRDEVVDNIVAALADNIERTDREHARRKDTHSLTAYEYVLRGRPHFNPMTAEGDREARRNFERAIELDPGYASAYAYLAWTYLEEAMFSWSKDPDKVLQHALRNAQKAVALDQSDGYAHSALACAHLYARRHERAEKECEIAVRLFPNDLKTIVLMGHILAYCGRLEEALEWIGKAFRLNPDAPDWYYRDLGLTQFAAQHYEEAIAAINAISAPPPEACGVLAASYALLGREDEARDALTRFCQVAKADMDAYPGVQPNGWSTYWSKALPNKHQSDLELLFDGLCKAGLQIGEGLDGATEAAGPRPMASSEKPSIAVLPFINLSDDPEQANFSDGITEDIITELARFRSLQVVARSSTFVYRDQSVNVTDAGRALGASYLLEGSLRKSGKRLRFTAQLIDVDTEKHIWAERYDRELTDIFAVQDELVHAIVTKLAGRLAAAETERSRRRRPENFTAHDYYLRGLQGYRQYSKESVLGAAKMLEKAVALDPGHAKAQALHAWCVSASAWWTSLGNYEPHSDRALSLARKALELEPDESLCQFLLAMIHLHRQEFEQARYPLECALALNPHDLFVRAGYASYVLYKGNPQQAVDQLDELKEFEPFPPNWVWEVRAYALYGLGRYEDAIAAWQRMTTLNYWNLGHFAACYGQLGQVEKAQACWAQMTEAIPDPILRMREDLEYYENQAVAEHWLEGLRKAGVTE